MQTQTGTSTSQCGLKCYIKSQGEGGVRTSQPRREGVPMAHLTWGDCYMHASQKTLHLFIPQMTKAKHRRLQRYV